MDRDDLRVVHACWDDRAVELLNGATTATAALRTHREHISRSLAFENGTG